MSAWKGLKAPWQPLVSWESSIMGQLRGPHHWLHYTWATYHIPYILVTRHCLAPAMDNFTNDPARGLSSGMAGCLQAICPQECSGYLWPGGLGECSMPAHRGVGGVLIFCTMPQISHISLGNLTQSIQTHLTSKLGIRFTQFLTIENLNSYKNEANYSAR